MREPWRTSVLVRFDATRHRSCFRVRHSIGLKETYSQVCAAFIARSLKRTNTGNQYGSRHKSRKRLFLQGLSQVAAAFYHLQHGNCAGTISAREPFPCCDLLLCLDGYPEAFAGVVVTPLSVAIRSWLEALEGGPQFSRPPVPQLQLTI